MIDWEKSFPIASLTRADLKEAGFSDEVIEMLTDEDMAVIASKLEDTYRDTQLYIDLEIEVNILIENKESSNA